MYRPPLSPFNVSLQDSLCFYVVRYIIRLDLSRAQLSFLNFSLIIQLLLSRFVYLKLTLVFNIDQKKVK